MRNIGHIILARLLQPFSLGNIAEQCHRAYAALGIADQRVNGHADDVGADTQAHLHVFLVLHTLLIRMHQLCGIRQAVPFVKIALHL